MWLFITGIGLLATIIFLFWLKDELRSPLLARLCYSEFVTRLAVIGAVIAILGILLIVGNFFSFTSEMNASQTPPHS